MSLKPPPPDIVIGRLPIYLRALDALAKEGHVVTSSYELGERLGISSAQIRKDLSHFGDFGKQGTGYQIDFLMGQLRQILKVNREWAVAIVGSGLVGQALANYQGFTDHGFKIAAIFDNAPDKIGTKMGKYLIQDIALIPEVVQQAEIQIAMIATPAEAAQGIADILIAAGVQSILNYAPIILNIPEHARVQYIDPVTELQHMTYYLQDKV